MGSIQKRKPSRQRASVPKSLAQYRALPARSQATIDNAAHVLTRMREGASLRHASAEHGIAPRTVVRMGGPALRKDACGRYRAKQTDNLVRVLVIPVEGGSSEVAVRGSRAASEIAKRAAAQQYFLHTGDDSKIRALRGKSIKDVSGREVPFLTDLDELERLGEARVLSFESIYARSV